MAVVCSALLPSLLTLLLVGGGSTDEQQQQPQQDYGLDQGSYREFSAGKGEKGLFPNIFNLATHAEIRATATCGQHGPEYYCKLVEHVFLRQPQCDICDANNHLNNHPIDNAIDGTRRWWQSPSLSNGLAYEKVNITIDLRQEYQVAYVIVKAAISPRPGTWALEKSLDGVTFTPWQYYANTDADCMRVFGVPATVGVPKFTKDDEVICTSYYSKLNPLEQGEIHTSLVNGRPGAENPGAVLQNFTKTRFVRLRLVGLRTLYADLMVINRRDGKLDHSVTRRYFYSISDISIGGQCICYGHAERCPPEETHGQFRCECRHNTCGESCNTCCPLYNQLPWRPGTHNHPNICQACQCFNHAIECVYDEEIERQRLSVTPEGIYEGGGKCMECQHNTDGINCEKCLPEFYRPINISHYRHDACRPCDCDLTGSENNNCIRDETEAHNALRPGDCICKPGFGGRRCDRCALGFRNHPVCDPCPCHQAGSLNFDTCEEEKCSCKENVQGELCDQCKPGTIYLDNDNPLGCQPCFCFGKTTECREQQWVTAHVSSHSGWNLTDLYGQLQIAPQITTNGTNELLIFNSDDYQEDQQPSLAHSIYYWKAPLQLLKGGGNSNKTSWLNSYGSNLYYYVYFVPREQSGGHPTPVADVIIEGNDLNLEYYSRLNFFPRENISVTIPLRTSEGNWYDSRTRRPVGKVELMRVLADVKNVYIRAKYHQDQLQSSLYGLRLKTVIESESEAGEGVTVSTSSQLSKSSSHPVEVCTCPEHFEGNSCERCEAGYRRVGNQLNNGICQRCECEGHSSQCDPHTGHCLNCQHNTTGPRCEQCLHGFYGNPSLGGELGSCKQCACPTTVNSHSTHCTLSQLVFEGAAAAADQDEYVCTACEAGYDGNKCEICADGYFGDAVEGSCQPCVCSGNIDAAAIGNCDRKTGECLRCIGHTAGKNCEVCEDNHWGSALSHSCHPCKCHHLGSVQLQCSNETGRCECKENYTGDRCDRCVLGHGDVENNCPSCECDETGSVGVSCDEQSGQCYCKNGVYGKQCDKCVPSYFNFTSTGCQFCECNEWGAMPGEECNNVTGKCQCQPNVEGLRCEKCAEGFFNLTSGKGCQPCECDQVGALLEECHPGSGQCKCKPGVQGLKCNKCKPNHYGLDVDGCKECKVCPAPGQVCDESTGDCVCPPHTQGAICERCSPNAWNYHPYSGCQLCDCDGVGSDGRECDSITGQCKCKAGYVGHKCDHCEAGYFNFPDCEPCDCNMAGTEPTQCKDSICLCTNEGQCKCKKHTTGLKCDQCANNSFSLEPQNPNGCTECFCFNRSISGCTQNTASWRQIYSPDREVRFEEPFEYYTRRHNIHILRESPLNYNSYPTNHTPLYWPLPSSFLGDRTASYNGFIRFRIRNDDNYRGHPNVYPESSTFRLFAQILLIGNHRVELEHIPLEISEDGKYKVRLHESQWRNRISPQLPVSRKQFMVTLQNLQAIYIRATYNHMFRGDTISLNELSLDVAAPSAANTTDDQSTGSSPAIGVELCSECSPGYTGDSCQNPIEGYCRKRDADYLNNPDDLALVGRAAQCSCNGHSTVCDRETCRCNDCEHNTVGDFCEYCRPGYYGNAIEGGGAGEEPCRKCACPLLDNSFSDTCRAASNTQGYVCDACKPGYTGQFCESCVSGYYGDPMAGGYCAVCGCHPFGSVHAAVCHPVTGQCPCREGVGGRDCSNCSPRHAFIGGLCTSCDGGCYKELMKIEDEMEHSLRSIQNFTDLKPIPRKRLNRIFNTVHSLDEILNSIQSSEADAQQLLQHVAGTENRYLKQANVVKQEFSLLEERNGESLAKLAALNNHLDRIRQLVHLKNRQVVDISSQLAELSHRAGGNQDQQPGDIQHLVLQAQQYLNSTRERDQNLEKELNYAKNHAEKSERLLKDIFAKKLDDTTYQGLLDKQLEFKANLKEYRDTLWDKAKANSQAAKTTSQTANQKVQVLEKTIADIQAFNQTSSEKLEASQQLVDSIKQNTDAIQDIYKEINESLLPILREQRESLTDIGNDYAQIYSPHYHANEVQKAQKHASDLEYEATNLKGFFTATQVFSTDALAASNAYKDIILTMKNATTASNVAKSNAQDAFIVVDSTSSDSLVNIAQATLNRSNHLSQQLEEALNELSISEETFRLQESLSKVEAIQAEIEKNSSWIRDVQQLLDDHHDRINTVHSTVDDTQLGFGDIQERTDEFTKQVESVKARADSIHGFDQKTIRETITNVSQSTAKISEMEKSLDSVRARTDQHNNQIKAISKDIGVLKEKINEAREKASKIRIAVKSDVGTNCIREYISPVNPAPTNTITLKYRPAIDSPDSLLFLTTTKGTRTQNREYIAVELKGKKIHVKWDIGDGRREAAIVKRNIVYIPASDRYTWYHIEVKRVANSMQVSVVQKQTLTGEGPKNVDEPTQVVVGEPDLSSQVIFNTLPGQTRIYVGHVDGDQVTEQFGLSTNRFYGTLGEITVDGVNVPLWVFDTSYGNCDGSAGLSTPMASGHMFRDGFAQIRMPMNERANTMISVAFSAYSPSGLLYFRGSPSTGEFIAVALEAGAVSLKAHMGGGVDGQTAKSIALLSIHNSYADGRAHKVRVIRKDGEVHLQVDTDEDHVSSALPDDTPALNIPEPDHYVGGVPPNFDVSKFYSHQIPFEGFFGCVQSVRPNQVSELDLDNPIRSQRKEPGCAYSKEDRLSTPDRVIGFSSPGYLLSKSPIQLSTQSSSVSFNLRTRSPNAVLLYQSAAIGPRPKRLRRDGENEEQGQEDKTFLGFYLYNGRLIGHLGTDNQQRLKRPSLSSNHSYNDGLLHSVFLSRTDSLVQMRIDDKEVLTAKLDDETTIGSPNHYILFGGFPPTMDTTQEHYLGTSEPLIGCLSDFQHNYEKLPIILEEHQSTLGTCEVDKKALEDDHQQQEDDPVDDQQPEEEGHLKPNFDRKKSKQSLEAVEPTFSASHYSQHPYLMSSIGRSRRRESTCVASLPYNWTNTETEGYRFGVSESSHARVNFAKPYPDYTSFNLSLSIKTSQKKGSLWVWASYKNFTRYFFLNIEKGFLVLEIKGHKQPKVLEYKAKRVNDNQWHRVQLAKQEKQASLQLDDLPPEYMRDAPNPKVMKKRMYVGGVISRHKKQFNLPLPGFSGCIKHLLVDGQEHNLLTTSRDVVPCSYSKDTTYIHDGGFTTFDPLHNHGRSSKEVEFSLHFRASQPKLSGQKGAKQSSPAVVATSSSSLLVGLMSTAEDSYQTARLTIRVDNSTLLLSAFFTKFRVNLEERFSSSQSNPGASLPAICAGQWHRLLVKLGHEHSTIVLDDNKLHLKQVHFPLAVLEEMRSLPVHIGGTTAPVLVALGTSSLHGCFKSVELSGVPVPLDLAKKSHKVIKEGCPY